MWETQVSHSCNVAVKIYSSVLFCWVFRTFYETACYDMLYSRFETHCKLTFCAGMLTSGPVLRIAVSRIGFLFWLTLFSSCEIGGLIGACCMWFVKKSWGLRILNKCCLYLATTTCLSGGTRWRSWLRYCATRRRLTGSIPGGVTGNFHWHKPSG